MGIWRTANFVSLENGRDPLQSGQPGSGYIYISASFVEFRMDARTIHQRIIHNLELDGRHNKKFRMFSKYCCLRIPFVVVCASQRCSPLVLLHNRCRTPACLRTHPHNSKMFVSDSIPLVVWMLQRCRIYNMYVYIYNTTHI